MKNLSATGWITIVFILTLAVGIGIGTMVKKAHGDTFVMEKATNATIADTASILRSSPSVNVKIITYMAVWDYDGMEPHLDRANAVMKHFNSLGVSNARIELNFANEKGLRLEPYDMKTGPNKIPAEDGVYLLLTY